MKHHNSFFSILAFLFSIILLFHSSVASFDALQKACNSVAATSTGTKVTYEFCVQFLGEYPQSQTASLEDLFLYSLDQLASNATNIVKSVIPKLLSNEALRQAQKCLSSGCSKFYKDVPSDLDDARSYFKAKDYKAASTYVSAVMTNSNSCEDCFREDLKMESPLATEDDVFHKMTSVSLAIIAMFF